MTVNTVAHEVMHNHCKFYGVRVDLENVRDHAAYGWRVVSDISSADERRPPYRVQAGINSVRIRTVNYM
jgi:hypothetical protein